METETNEPETLSTPEPAPGQSRAAAITHKILTLSEVARKEASKCRFRLNEIAFLDYLDANGPSRIKVLTADFAIGGGGVMEVLNRLKRRGLITRTHRPGERILYSISRNGFAVLSAYRVRLASALRA